MSFDDFLELRRKQYISKNGNGIHKERKKHELTQKENQMTNEHTPHRHTHTHTHFSIHTIANLTGRKKGVLMIAALGKMGRGVLRIQHPKEENIQTAESVFLFFSVPRHVFPLLTGGATTNVFFSISVSTCHEKSRKYEECFETKMGNVSMFKIILI